jgi:hypothetical protein
MPMIIPLALYCSLHLLAHGDVLHRSPESSADSSTQALRADIMASADTLRLRDPKLAAGAVRFAFDSAISSLASLPNSTPRHRLIVKWAEAIATLHDGHTQLGLARDEKIGFHQYPIRIYWFEEGFFITGTTAPLTRALGAQVFSIDGTPVSEVATRIRPVIHGDNETAIRNVLPSRMTLGEVLEAKGVSSSLQHATFVVRRADGMVDTLALEGIPVCSRIDFILARQRLKAPPLYLSAVNRPYWFTYIGGPRTMYVQFNAVENDSTELFDAFVARLFRAVDSLPVSKLVLDIRNNNGGDNTLLRPLELGLIRSKLNQRGRLFVITGRLTFSAAVNLAADLEKWTEATFVGEPTSAPANHFGETQAVTLGRTGILLLYSSLYYQSVGDPKDSRTSIPPGLPVSVRASDYFAGRDAALEAVLAQPLPGHPSH